MEVLPLHGPSYGHLATPHVTPALLTSILFVILATMAVALRFWARGMHRGHYYPHDWMVLAALIIFYGYTAAAILCMYTSLNHLDDTNQRP